MSNFIHIGEGDPKPFMLIINNKQTYYNVFNHAKLAYQISINKDHRTYRSTTLYVFINDKYYPLKDYFKVS